MANTKNKEKKKQIPWNKGLKGMPGHVPWNKGLKGVTAVNSPPPAIPEAKVPEAVQMVVAGESHKEIARVMGTGRGTIRDFKEKHKDLIEKELLRVLDSLPDIVGLDMEEIKAASVLSRMIRSKTPLADKKGNPHPENPTQFTTIDEVMRFLDHVAAKANGYKKALGILPSATPAPVLMFISNDNRKQMQISPVMAGLVKALTGQESSENGDSYVSSDSGEEKGERPLP